MKEFYSFFSRASFCLVMTFILLAGAGEARAQYYTKTPIVHGATAASTFTGSYYEFLPPGYDPNGSTLYPIMIFNHGSGEAGDGSAGQLPYVLANGPPKLINNGTFPTSFTVNGNTYTFIVLAPQMNGEDFGSGESAFVDFALSHYKADPDRLYITGLSAGGTPTWYYPAISAAKTLKIAALLPISGHGELDPSDAVMMAQNHLPVFALHNTNDPTVPTEYTVNNVNNINSYAGVNPAALIHLYSDPSHDGTHDAWTTTYNPATTFTETGGLNVYQWMLQYSRGGSGTPLPVSLINYTAALTADGTEVNVGWTTTIEQNNKDFVLQRSGDGQNFSSLDTIASAAPSGGGHTYTYTDKAPLSGNNFYRLSQVDLDGKTTLYGILKVTVGMTGQSFTLKLSPNPTSNALFLEGTQGGQGTLQIDLSDVQGKVLKTWSLQRQGSVWNKTIDVSNLPRGNYFIRVQGTGVKSVQQFSKQ